LKESQQIINEIITDISTEIINEEDEVLKINISQINQFSNPKAYLYQLLKDYKFTAWNDVYNLLSAQSGKQVFSKNYRLLKDREFLILSKIDFSNSLEMIYRIKENQSEIKKPIHLTLEEIDEKSLENKHTIYVDKDLLKYPLIVRKRKNGDYLYPTKMEGKKKLSKFFKDEKFSLIEKENTWLLCNAEEQIIWVINYRQDRRFVGNQKLKITLHS
jgi:tRNA(Ile)-lysidine synthase